MKLLLLGYILLGLLYLTFTYLAIKVRNENVKLKHAQKKIIENFNNSNLKIWAWAINPDRKKMEDGSKRFLDTCKKFNIDAELIGIGYEYKRHQNQDRFYVLRDKLNSVKDNQIVVVMDAFDTLMNGTEQEIVNKFLEKNTNILFSAEKAYNYQYMEYKNKFLNDKSPYKYINAGTFMGYAKDLKKMNDDCIYMLENNEKYKNAAEMGLMGIWVSERINNKNLIKLDTNCDIFWVTTDDYEILRNESKLKNKMIKNKNTNTKPCILHVIGGNAEDLRSSDYNNAYLKVINF